MARGGYRPNAGRKAGDTDPKGNRVGVAGTINDLAEALENGDLIGGGFKKAEDFLMAVVNNPLLDVKLRVNAAATVLPYQSAKVGEEKQGKKAAKAEAAQNAGNDSEWGDDLKTRNKLTVVK